MGKQVPWWAYVSVILLFIVSCLCLLMALGINGYGASEVITMAEYNALQPNTSYARAVEIIGSEGTEISRSDYPGYVTVMYMWQNNDGSNMNAMFQNDKLITKAQFGLK